MQKLINGSLVLAPGSVNDQHVTKTLPKAYMVTRERAPQQAHIAVPLHVSTLKHSGINFLGYGVDVGTPSPVLAFSYEIPRIWKDL